MRGVSKENRVAPLQLTALLGREDRKTTLVLPLKRQSIARITASVFSRADNPNFLGDTVEMN